MTPKDIYPHWMTYRGAARGSDGFVHQCIGNWGLACDSYTLHWKMVSLMKATEDLVTCLPCLAHNKGDE